MHFWLHQELLKQASQFFCFHSAQCHSVTTVNPTTTSMQLKATHGTHTTLATNNKQMQQTNNTEEFKDKIENVVLLAKVRSAMCALDHGAWILGQLLN